MTLVSCYTKREIFWDMFYHSHYKEGLWRKKVRSHIANLLIFYSTEPWKFLLKCNFTWKSYTIVKGFFMIFNSFWQWLDFTRKSNESLLPILIVSWLSRLRNFHYNLKINLKSSFMIFFIKLLTCTYPIERRDYVTYFYLLLLQGKASWSDKFDESHWKRIGFGCIWSIGSYHGKLRKIIYNDTFF